MYDDARILRDRMSAAYDAWNAAQAGGPEAGSDAQAVVTTTVTSYPTTAGAMFAVLPCDIDGNESEGATATFVPRAGADPFFAFNLGTAIPPSGTELLVHEVGTGRWAFRYDS